MKTKLFAYIFEETSDEAFQELEEFVAGGVAGPMLPLGAKGAGSSEGVERALWGNKKGKRVKTASLKKESFGAMHKPDFKGPAMPGLWQGLEDTDEPVKTGSPELDKDI